MSLERRASCPECDHLSVIRVLDLPVCQQTDCDWTGSRPVRDGEWTEHSSEVRVSYS